MQQQQASVSLDTAQKNLFTFLYIGSISAERYLFPLGKLVLLWFRFSTDASSEVGQTPGAPPVSPERIFWLSSAEGRLQSLHW